MDNITSLLQLPKKLHGHGKNFQHEYFDHWSRTTFTEGTTAEQCMQQIRKYSPNKPFSYKTLLEKKYLSRFEREQIKRSLRLSDSWAVLVFLVIFDITLRTIKVSRRAFIRTEFHVLPLCLKREMTSSISRLETSFSDTVERTQTCCFSNCHNFTTDSPILLCSKLNSSSKSCSSEIWDLRVNWHGMTDMGHVWTWQLVVQAVLRIPGQRAQQGLLSPLILLSPFP